MFGSSYEDGMDAQVSSLCGFLSLSCFGCWDLLLGFVFFLRFFSSWVLRLCCEESWMVLFDYSLIMPTALSLELLRYPHKTREK